MRVGVLAAGVVVTILGAWFWWFAYFLLPLGVILILLGALLPAPSRPGMDQFLVPSILHRLWQLEGRQISIEDKLARIEERLGLPPMEGPPSRAPAPLSSPPPEGIPPPTPTSPRIAEAPSPALVPARTYVAPEVAPPPRPTAPVGMSRLELELGEKWFQWIGIIVLTVAFLFLLAIVLPNLSPVQIVAVDFAAALGLALLAEYIFARRGLKDYAKGLEAGAFGLAYIGVWGGGFFFGLPGFPWPSLLGATFGLHAAAAVRYRSPLLTIEVGLLYLAWILWLRVIEILTPAGLATLLSVGGLAVLGVVYVLREERSALTLTFAFDAATLLASGILAPFGYLPVLAVGLVTVAVVTLFRVQKVLALPPRERMAFWAVGIVLAYGLLIANGLPIRGRGGIDDLVILATYATLTAAFMASEFLAPRDQYTLPFAALLAVMSFPIPLLMARGELALLVYPAFLVALSLVRPTRGLAAFVNVVYLGLIAFVALPLRDPSGQIAVAWGVFLGAMVLHADLQRRSGYIGIPEGFPQDIQLPFYVVALAGLTARAVPGPVALGMYLLALPFAVLLNRGCLLGRPGAMAALVLTVAAGMAVARSWALAEFLRDAEPLYDGLLGAYHVGVLVALGLWIAYRKPVTRFGGVALRRDILVCIPAVALLAGLAAQSAYSSPIFLVLVLTVVGVAYSLDDAVTFNAGYLVLAGQSVVTVLSLGAGLSEAFRILPTYAAILIGFAILLELRTSRGTLARTSQVTGGFAWFAWIPLAFGLQVETTIAWTAVAGVLIAWGLWRRFAPVRYVGFASVFAVLGKVFLWDIRGVGIELRILGLITVATALLAISYGYSRYRKGHGLMEPGQGT